jgi:hypothetical protein
MDWDWKKITRRFRVRWDRSDRRFALRGQRDQLIVQMHEAYGLARDAADAQLRDFESCFERR